jgi:hypothetical protein
MRGLGSSGKGQIDLKAATIERSSDLQGINVD